MSPSSLAAISQRSRVAQVRPPRGGSAQNRCGSGSAGLLNGGRLLGRVRSARTPGGIDNLAVLGDDDRPFEARDHRAGHGSALPGERATAVTIYRLLQKSVFGPDDIERLATAYESALRILELNDRDDPITEIIARRIIEAAQTGLRDPDSLCATAIKDFRVP